MAFEIYKIYNDVNDKVYIGQTTKGIDIRFKQHRQGTSFKLQQAFDEIGIEHFAISVIDDSSTSQKELTDKENFYISLYNSIENGYNSHAAGMPREIEDRPHLKPMSINLGSSLKSFLQEEAKKQNRSLANLILTILIDYVNNR